MAEAQQLAGKRIAVLAADGFEQAELATPVASLKAAGARVEILALRPGRIRGMQVHQLADLERVDCAVQAARAADFDGVYLPGGYIGPDLLRQSGPARAFVREIDAAGKPIAAMSQAALLLVSAGLARGRTLTSWPGVRDDLVNAGATWLNQPVVRDGAYLFGRGPQDLAAFTQALGLLFADVPLGAPSAAAADPPLPMAESDPPQEEPSEMPGQPLRWLSAPSVGAMLSLALLGVGVVAANRGRRKRRAGDDAAQAAAPPGRDAMV